MKHGIEPGFNKYVASILRRLAPWGNLDVSGGGTGGADSAILKRLLEATVPIPFLFGIVLPHRKIIFLRLTVLESDFVRHEYSRIRRLGERFTQADHFQTVQRRFGLVIQLGAQRKSRRTELVYFIPIR